MNIKHCSRCGGIFTASLSNSEVCPLCLKQSEEDYKRIFDYFITKPAATAQEIFEDTGIELQQIYRFVRENRLRSVKKDTGLNCEKCGSPIYGVKLGKLCEKCRSQLSAELKKGVQKKLSLPDSASGTSKQGSSNPAKTAKTPKKH